jgi:nucleotide-binding universal stress UspA family protein
MSASQSKRIVAGVDGSPSSVRALQWASSQAELTGSVVDAIYAWHYPATYGVPVVDVPDYAALAEEVMAKALAEARPVDGTAQIRPHVVEGHPVQVLLDAARGADLLVVGSRGHGGFSGALLGSVSQNVVHHAPCPVVVIRGASGHDGPTGPAGPASTASPASAG